VQLFIASLLLSLLPLLIIGWLSFSKIVAALSTQAEVQSQHSLQQTVGLITAFVEGRLAHLAELVKLEMVQVSFVADKFSWPLEDFRDYYTQLVESQPSYAAIHLYTMDGREVMSSRRREIPFEVSGEPWFQAALKQRTYVSDMILNEAGIPVILLAQVVQQWGERKQHFRMGVGKDVGFVALEIKGTAITSFVERLQTRDTAYAFLVDRTGAIIPPGTEARLIPGHLLADTQASALQEIGREMIAGKAGSRRFTYAGVERFFFYTPCNLSGWSIALTVPADELLVEAHRLRMYLYYLLFGSLCASIAFGGVASLKISAPITALSQKAAQIGRGKFEASLEAHSSSEIGLLAASFNQMARDLMASRKEIEAKTSRLEVLYRLSQTITASMDQHTVTQEILAATQLLIPGAACRFWERVEDDQALRLVVSCGLRHSEGGARLRFRPGEGLAGIAIATRQPVISQDVRRDPRFINKDWAAAEGLVSCLILPLIYGEQIRGVLAVFSREPHEFTNEEVDLLRSFAAQAAIAESARLFQEVREQAATLAQANAQLHSEIAERQRAEEALEQQAQELARSNAELEQFAYVASHDLQEPLRKIRAFGDRLTTTCAEALSDQGGDYLQRMQQAATRMQTLINDLLAYSRVRTKAQPFVPVDLAQVAREVMSDLEVRLEQTGGHMEVEEFPILDADPMQMRQLLQNLVSNALKFRRQEAAPVVKLHGRFLQEQEQGAAGNAAVDVLYQITVADNGIGFDEKYSERIFGVFQRLHGRNHYEGTGVGLAICKKIAERHGGTITAHSTPGQGATFIVTLPVTQPKETSNVYTGNADDHPDGR
jgi:signal transduction histidine kinase